jgi:hypothetical protein
VVVSAIIMVITTQDEAREDAGKQLLGYWIAESVLVPDSGA